MHNTESIRSWSDQLEETLIALILGVMTLITFANVIARYVFNSNILWALETTVFLFAWLVLVGAAYAVKNNLHIGVDILVRALPASMQKTMAITAVLCSLLFCLLAVYGAYQYWLPFAGERAWYEVDDIPAPDVLQMLAGVMNEGERWEKLPRFIPYFCLPLGFTLLTLRFLQVARRVFAGEQVLLVTSHDANEATSGDADSENASGSVSDDASNNASGNASDNASNNRGTR
jgi:C4-dicarboxylate transporter DctQ subunit